MPDHSFNRHHDETDYDQLLADGCFRPHSRLQVAGEIDRDEYHMGFVQVNKSAQKLFSPDISHRNDPRKIRKIKSIVINSGRQ